MSKQIAAEVLTALGVPVDRCAKAVVLFTPEHVIVRATYFVIDDSKDKFNLITKRYRVVEI